MMSWIRVLVVLVCAACVSRSWLTEQPVDEEPYANVDTGLWTAFGGAEPRPRGEMAHDASNEGGGFSRSLGTSTVLAAALEGGSPVVVYQDAVVSVDRYDDTSRLMVRRWDGETWRGLAGADGSFAECSSVRGGDLVIHDGAVVVAALCGDLLLVRRFDGTRWLDLLPAAEDGLAGFPSFGNRGVQLEAGDNGLLWLALTGNGGFLWRYQDGVWTEAGGDMSNGVSFASTVDDNVALATRAGHDPVAAWLGGDGRVYAARWADNGWVALGSSLAAADRTPCVTIGANAEIVVGWLGSSAGFRARRWSGSTWENVDSTTGREWRDMRLTEVDGQVWAVGLALATPGFPWMDTIVEVRALEGSWSVLDDAERGISSLDIPIGSVTVASSDNRAVVAWSDIRGEAYLLQYAGGSWEPLGRSTISHTPFPTALLIDKPILRYDSTLGAFLVWSHSNHGFHGYASSWTVNGLYAASLDGSGWSEVTPGSLSGVGLSDYNVPAAPAATAASGQLGVAWIYEFCGVRYRSWDGSSWREHDGSGSNYGINGCAGGDTRMAAVAFDAGGNPWVAWQDHCDYWNIFVMRWTGSAWDWASEPMCTSLGASKQRTASYPTLASSSAGTFLGWEGLTGRDAVTGVYGKMWNGDAFEQVDGSASGRGIGRSVKPAAQLRAAIDEQGRVFTAWMQATDDGPVIHARMLADGTWRELDGSATGRGLSLSYQGSSHPEIVVDRGRPIVAWTERDESWCDQVYLAMYDGGGWIQLSGSASAGGVSNSEAPSGPSSLAVIDDQVCVAWKEPAVAADQIYVRCVPLP